MELVAQAFALEHHDFDLVLDGEGVGVGTRDGGPLEDSRRLADEITSGVTCSICVCCVLASPGEAGAASGVPSRDMQARLKTMNTTTVGLERNVAMFLRRILVAFVSE